MSANTVDRVEQVEQVAQTLHDAPAPGRLRDVASMSNTELYAEAQALMASLEAHKHDWAVHARPEQREPAEYTNWLILAGRGYGKTRTGAETARARGTRQGGLLIAVIGRNYTDVRDTCFEHRRSGLQAVIPAGEIASYNRSLGSTSLILKNGTEFRGFSAEEPDRMRGPAFDFVWGDEFAAWPRNTAQAAYDMAWFCLREAVDPAMLLTTTPQALPHVRKLVERAKREPKVVITAGTTWDNAANLSETALAELNAMYGNSRLGRQELGGELLGDVADAFVALSTIDKHRLVTGEVPMLTLTVTAVDPATTKKLSSDETGIVTVGVDGIGQGYVLDDDSGHYSPDEWGRATWAAVQRNGSSVVVVEDNQGGDMVEHVLRTTWQAIVREARAKAVILGAHVPIVRVHPSGEGQGKWDRARPVAVLYDQGRIHHVYDTERIEEIKHPDGSTETHSKLRALEDQASTWTGRPGEVSPDRVDAMVHGLRWCLFPGQRVQPGGKTKRTALAPAQHRWTRGTRR